MHLHALLKITRYVVFGAAVPYPFDHPCPIIALFTKHLSVGINVLILRPIVAIWGESRCYNKD